MKGGRRNCSYSSKEEREREGGKTRRTCERDNVSLPAQPPLSVSPSGDASELAACLVVVVGRLPVVLIGSVGLVLMLLLLREEEEEERGGKEEDRGRTKKAAARHGNSSRSSQERGVMAACFYVPSLLLPLLLLCAPACPPRRLGNPHPVC